MPISDLTGTKWIFNDSPTITSEQNWSVEGALVADTENEFNTIYLLYDTSYTPPYTGLGLGNIALIYEDGTWFDNNFKSIIITGGTDATNADLIAWLEANATQQTPVQTSGGMYFGALGISKVFFGTSEVSKIYLGDALVYEGVSIPDNALLTADNTYLVDSTGGYLLTTETALISFDVDSIPYQAESGMTWQEWVNSEYNTNGYIVENDTVKTADLRDVVANGTTSVLPSKPIIANTSYTYIATGGGADF